VVVNARTQRNIRYLCSKQFTLEFVHYSQEKLASR
jgi:hypothetical protein